MSETDYAAFLAAKHPAADELGFAPPALSPLLLPFQRRIVEWAVRRGRAALFCPCGTGKSFMQLEWARCIVQHTGQSVVILAPLAVTEQTYDEAQKFGIDGVRTITDQSQVDGPGIYIINYDKLHHIDPSHFVGVVLDESSILKSFMGATKRKLLDAFAATPYRLACTATPAPNDHMELGNHADFLGVMPSNEMLMRWFINDASEAGNYRLKKHAAADFWRWMSEWAVSLEKPSDLGDSDDGFTLPPLNLHHDIVAVDWAEDAGAQLFRTPTLSATTLHKEMRLTAPARAAAVAARVRAEPGEAWVIWCHTNYEADAIRAALPDAVEVRGSDSTESKEQAVRDFRRGAIRILLSKPSMFGFGLNLQHCARVAFVGLSYSFEQFYQAVRRTWRFGQTRPVDVYIVGAETEGPLLATIRRKERDHDRMIHNMVGAMRMTHDLSADRQLTTTTGPLPETSGPGWRLLLGDCVEGLRGLPDNSVHHSVHSPPFANLYIYSDHVADMGNAADMTEFLAHYRFAIREMYRVLVPGAICAVHCKDLPLYKGRDGSAGLYDFPGDLIRAFTAEGWTFHSRVTIWKSPVTEMQRTKNHGLLYKSLRADSRNSRMGMADYVLAFRKWTDSDEAFPHPVTHTHEQFPLDQWQEWASPVWMDIDQMDVLNYRSAKGDQDERHICPLQLGVIRRCLRLWSNPGDVVLSPFAGIGSEGYVALQEGRQFLGIELKPEYYTWAVRHLEQAERAASAPTLFDTTTEDIADAV